MKCYCCGGEVNPWSTCSYCGFKAARELDEPGKTLNIDAAASHKKNLLSMITNIYVISYDYKYNSAKNDFDLCHDEKSNKSPQRHIISTGSECNNKKKWAKMRFAQNPDLSSPRELTVYYKMYDEIRSVQVSFGKNSLVKCTDFWQIGVKIDENLRLVVYIGDATDSNKQAVSDPVELDLK